jgi:hypothetical protein
MVYKLNAVDIESITPDTVGSVLASADLTPYEPFLLPIKGASTELLALCASERHWRLQDVTQLILQTAFANPVTVGGVVKTQNEPIDYTHHAHAAVAVLCLQGHPYYVSIFSADNGKTVDDSFPLKTDDFLFVPDFYHHGAELRTKDGRQARVNPNDRHAIVSCIVLSSIGSSYNHA